MIICHKGFRLDKINPVCSVTQISFENPTLFIGLQESKYSSIKIVFVVVVVVVVS